MGAVKTYDEKSYYLAVHFLHDEPQIDTEDHRHRLARAIQTAIEDYIADVMPVPSGRPITTYLCPKCKQTSVADRDRAGNPICTRCGRHHNCTED